MQPFLISIQKVLVSNKKMIEGVFLSLEIMLVLGLGVWIYLLSQGLYGLDDTYLLGKNFGLMALGWYCLSLLPGIMQRLRFQPLLAAMLTLFRRHFGIMMFLSALLHYFATTISFVIFSDVPPILNTAQTFGWLAFLLAMPLWVTSNTSSERKLGKWWKRIHRITYLILLLVFGHLVFFANRWAWLAGAFIGLELLSWAVAWRRVKTSQTIVQ